jgi:hypothetical protein
VIASIEVRWNGRAPPRFQGVCSDTINSETGELDGLCGRGVTWLVRAAGNFRRGEKVCVDDGDSAT